jgi:hypothetical protein
MELNALQMLQEKGLLTGETTRKAEIIGRDEVSE